MHNEQIDNDYHRAQTCHEQVLMPVILLQQISDGKYNIWYEQQRGDKSGNIASDRHGLSYMHNKMYAESPRQCTQRDFCRAIDSAYCCQDDEQQFFSNDDAETIGAHIPQMFKHRSSKGESAAYTICVKVHRSSRAREFHPHPLTEPCVKVSPHTALHTQFFVHRHNLGV